MIKVVSRAVYIINVRALSLRSHTHSFARGCSVALSFCLLVRHQRLYSPCYIVVSFGKGFLWGSTGVEVASATLVDKLIQIQPIRPVSDIFLEHEGDHLLQVVIVAMAEPRQVGLDLRPVEFRAVVQIALVLSLE